MPEMLAEYNISIPLRDGSIVRANLYRPQGAERVPVIMTMGPYGKDLHFGEFSPTAYEKIAEHGPHLNWETPNPEWWADQGYGVLRVDQRGAGASPGQLAVFSHQQALDFYDAIEWAGVQPWSTGKVGLLGVSYYAITQWQVAALQPAHLCAIIPWEGFVGLYREAARHGGILNNAFLSAWYPRQVLAVQNGADGHLSEEERAKMRVDPLPLMQQHVLDDAYYQEVTPDVEQIQVPLLSVGNWGGVGLHLRGNIEGYLGAASKNKWLRVHVGNHYTPFYSEEGRAVQKRFFDYWLKGIENGLLSDPPIQLTIRKGAEHFWRAEQQWPLARTQWTRLYLDATTQRLETSLPSTATSVNYQAPEGGVTFYSAPFEQDQEVTGPLSLRVWVSSTSSDLDLFVTLRNLDPYGNEITTIGTTGAPAAVAKGWLRASQRRLDPLRSLHYRPYHSHDVVQPLVPGSVVPLDVEIWPTSMIFERGHRLALDLQAHDGAGSFPFFHTDPVDRSPEKLAGQNTIYSDHEHLSFLLLPLIPSDER